MTVSEDILSPYLPELKNSGKFWIAYSGGLDSHVLLQALSKIHPSDSLVAVHINHGLSPNADAWQRHCQEVCEALGITFQAHGVEIHQGSSESLENLAREARYSIFNACVEEDDYLLMGHHQNDQVETMVYRLMRGTGPRGLSGIPGQRNLDKGQLLRPLLKYSRDELLAYAKLEGLVWIEDESNQNTDFDRNYLRQEIMPLLTARWPGFEKRWQRTAELCAEADQLQFILGKQDLSEVKTLYPNRINIKALLEFDDLRQRNILRAWFTGLEQKFSIPMPDYHTLHRILNEVLLAAEDSEPLVSWSNNVEQIDARRFANELYVLKNVGFIEPEIAIEWDCENALELPDNLGALRLTEVGAQGMNLAGIKHLRIAFRQGGEQAKPAGRKTRSLKKIFQDYSVPPWLRNRVPLIYVDDELAAVGDLFICDKWQCDEGKNLHRFSWERSDIHCGY